MIRNVRPKDTTKFVIVKVIGEDVGDQSSGMRRDPCWFRDKRIETIGIHEIDEVISRDM